MRSTALDEAVARYEARGYVVTERRRDEVRMERREPYLSAFKVVGLLVLLALALGVGGLIGLVVWGLVLVADVLLHQARRGPTITITDEPPHD